MPTYVPYLFFFTAVCIGGCQNILAKLGISPWGRPEPYLIVGGVFTVLAEITLLFGFKAHPSVLLLLGLMLLPFAFKTKTPPANSDQSPPEADIVQRRS